MSDRLRRLVYRTDPREVESVVHLEIGARHALNRKGQPSFSSLKTL